VAADRDSSQRAPSDAFRPAVTSHLTRCPA